MKEQIKERPILFSTEMVRAILDGRKTMTRRVVKPRIGDGSFDIVRDYQGSIVDIQAKDEHGSHVGTVQCPKGNAGDLLWVRETWSKAHDHKGDFSHYNYKADKDPLHEGLKWNPSLFMPKSAARLWLQITDVRVDRLHDISEEDAVKEGIELIKIHGVESWKRYDGYRLVSSSPLASFWSLWASIKGEESWLLNPWVWVISFKMLSVTGKESINNKQ